MTSGIRAAAFPMAVPQHDDGPAAPAAIWWCNAIFAACVICQMQAVSQDLWPNSKGTGAQRWHGRPVSAALHGIADVTKLVFFTPRLLVGLVARFCARLAAWFGSAELQRLRRLSNAVIFGYVFGPVVGYCTCSGTCSSSSWPGWCVRPSRPRPASRLPRPPC